MSSLKRKSSLKHTRSELSAVVVAFYFDQLAVSFVLEESVNEIVSDIIPNTTVAQLHRIAVLRLQEMTIMDGLPVRIL